MPCAARECESNSATVPRKVDWEVAREANCLNSVIIKYCFGCGSDQLQRNGPYDAWPSEGRIEMNRTLTKLAAAGALSLCAAVPALAGSVTQPGETVGLNTGAPLPQGWYAINTVDWGCMEHRPAAHMYGPHHSGRC